ncbi:MAG TPA: methyl-accepting chemotaxis protein [Aromatoleum sp.]|uniref:methyl-accepting chemotaxis protein n=1 Tax=Aromatoleum sp. TaxID=2307007 RepID=UPI002B4595AF|nr:methyl-accepting chemotaxis protein [Aromatoleum sp.]HJV28249.1 methyl-accepting chemotaxis protein [Aromatoleum sp.]
MKGLFLPAVAIMNRLSYRAKFALIGSFVFAAFAVLLVALANQLNATIEHSRSELVASGLARPLLKTVELVQQHRGMSAALLGGLTAMSDRRKETEKAADEAFAALDRALPEADRADPAWKDLRGQWAALQRDGLGWSQPENTSAHTRLVDALLSYQIVLSDRYGLTFDPEAESYYLMATAVVRTPFVLERLGRLRAKGAAALARGSMDDAARTELSVLTNEVRAALRDLKVNVAKISAQRPDLKDRLETSLNGFETRLEEVLRVVQEILGGDFFVTLSSSYFDLATGAMTVGYEQAYEIMLPTLDEVLKDRIDHASRILYFNIGMLLVMLGVIGYLSVGSYVSIIGGVSRLSSESARLAAGDLTARIDVQARDELGMVSKSFNEMAATMGRLIASIQRESGELAEAARGMLDSARQVDTASQRQSEAASSMAAAVEEMTVGIDHIATNAGNANELARKSGRLSGEGGEIVESVIREIGEIAESVSGSARTIEQLGQSSEQISAIVGVIKEIADQTNLLALNAAIEAARAGEQGRGFAVVADEVRKLAERTTHSTQEIAGMVGAIQQGARAAVESMNHGVVRVSEGVERAQQAGKAMALIREEAGRVVDTVAEISEALREQSSASTEIARNVETIARMAEENSSSAAGSLHTANRLEELAESLQGDVARFRVS